MESYINPGFYNSGTIEENHLKFIASKFNIPDDLFPLSSFEKLSPEQLTKLDSAIDELGGKIRVKELLATFAEEDLSIQQYIGGGAWGHVFRFLECSSAQEVAVKIFKPPYEEKWKSRVEREVLALEKLNNISGIPRLRGAFRERLGFLCMPMEYIPGQNLAELNTPINVMKAMKICRQILEILKAVHEQGVIHRDLHGGNVILDGDRITILDFGLARNITKDQYSRSFNPVGAMSHCAPEKWLEPSSAGPASDIFSVGVMLYKLLTGKMPFWSDTYIQLYEQIK